MKLHLSFALLALLVANPSVAKPFSTSYLTLQIPDSWKCEAIAQSWVCRSTTAAEQNSAALVLTAKQASPEDHLQNLEKQLSRQRTVKGPKGVLVSSRLEWSRQITLAGVKWLEAQQKNSEINGFYSYYLATVANGKTILLNINYEASQAKVFFPLLTKIRDSIVLKQAEPGELQPLPLGAEPTPPVVVVQPQPAPVRPMGVLSLLPQTPGGWAGVAAVVCLLLLALLW